MKYSLALQYAKTNRKNPTQAEAYFWEMVRAKKFNDIKFYRQYIISYKLSDRDNESFFIVDFFSHRLKLIIEIDGRVHDYQNEYDKYRTEILLGLDFTVIRFTNSEILSNWDLVESKLLRFVETGKL